MQLSQTIDLIEIPHLIELELQGIANSSMIEECALLFGRDEGKKMVVEKYVQLYNIDQSSVSFQMRGDDVMKAMSDNSDKDIVGVWHSHPKGIPYPSQKDFEFMNNLPYVWVIYSKKEQHSNSFLRIPESVFPIKIVEEITE